MKNLKIFHEDSTDDEKLHEKLQSAVKMCINVHDELLYFALKDHRIIVVDRHLNMIDQMSLFTQENGEDEGHPKYRLIGFDYLYDDQQLCMIYDAGLVVTLSTKTKEVKEAMDLKKSICGCSWSPDLQFLIVATEMHLLMISREFKIGIETLIRPTSTGKDQLLTIGWGSAETQFQGSLGKQNREKQSQQNIPIRDEFDDKMVNISWRADAQFFAVNSVDEVLIPKQQDSPAKASKNVLLDKILCRQLRIWNRDMEFMSHCEFLAGMEAAVCMRPSGNLIAVPRMFSNERHIWFYERNGQNRSKFTLDEHGDETETANSVVRFLAWNLDSTIMMIYYENKAKKTNFLRFWTASNYSWTEKLRLEIDELIDSQWDPECIQKFHYLTLKGVYCTILLQNEYSCEDMITLSVNGDRIRVTDLKYAPIPPPMCHYELCLDYVGVPSAFAQSHLFGLAVIGSNSDKVSVYNISNRRLNHQKDVAFKGNSRLLLNVIWRDENTLFALRKNEQIGLYELVELRLDSVQISIVKAFETMPFAQCVSKKLNWKSNNEESRLQIEYTKLTDDDWLLTFGAVTNYEIIGGFGFKTINLADEALVFFLNSKHQLFVNGREIHSSIVHFSCTQEFLILVTSEHCLCCISTKALQKFLKNGERTQIEQSLECGRQVERCAQVISNEPNGSRVWLQMPRGNLEIIHPRPIILERVKKHLDAMEWRRAYGEMRRHRIDLNLIYDHNPKAFIDHIEDFVGQIDDVDSLNVFISSLHSSDTSREMFAAHYPGRQPKPKTAKQKESKKVNTICERMRNHLLHLEDDNRITRFFPVILSCFIAEKPSRISTALTFLYDRFEKLSTLGPSQDCHRVATKWIKHLTYMVNENVLFNQSLKTYDLKIALMVAQQTTLDPKEFLPILNDLKTKSPPLYQKFHIELFLEDWQSALEHIAALAQEGGEEEQSSPFLEECIQHIQRYSLYSSALKLFCRSPRYKDICGLVAKAMEKEGKFKEAALLYEKAVDFDAAMNCFVRIQDFHGYLRLAEHSEQPKSKIDSDLKKIGAQLMHKANYLTAAKLFVHLGKEDNFEKILECFEKANAWKKLTNFVFQNSSTAHDIENRAQILLSTRCTQIIEQVDSWKDAINKHTKRLIVLRQEKMAKITALIDHEGRSEEFDEQLDTFSESSITSGASVSSRCSHYSASRKKTKKSARKKQQIREGSQWEDGALMVALKDIYQRIDGQQDELVELIPALFSMNLLERALRLQTEMVDVIDFAAKNHKQIWPSHLEVWHLSGPIAELYRGEDNVIRLPTNQDAMMPARILLDDELYPPKFRSTGAEWKLEIIQ